jgi:DNA repair exonuclease SbcCD ATPase subunit
VLLGVTLLGGCRVPGSSDAGQERCRQLSAAAGHPITAALTYMRCLPTTDRRLESEKAAADAAAKQTAARRAALEACRSRRERITALMASLRKAEEELAAARNTPFRPSVPPPPPLDASKESRYRLEDQQLDRERYEADLGAWEQQLAGERANWREQKAQRIDAAQTRLDRDAQTLRSLQPDLFTGPASIEFNTTVMRRVAAPCGSEGEASVSMANPEP